MALVDFNRGGEFTLDLLEALGSSGDSLIDNLRPKPAETIQQRERIATALQETLLAGSSSIRALINRAIKESAHRRRQERAFVLDVRAEILLDENHAISRERRRNL